MKSYTVVLILVGMMWMTGCATTTPRRVSQKTLDKEAAQLYAGFIQSAKSHAESNNYREALESYKLALTVKPNDNAALEGRRQMENMAARKAQEYYQQGLRLNKQGKYASSRERFMAALRLKPDYGDALEMLTRRQRIQVTDYVAHTIAPGENLSIVAKKYYGDYKQFKAIAEFNELKDATQIRVGQMVKVPRVDTLPFNADPSIIVSAWSPEETDSEATDEMVDQVAIYRDQGMALFKEARYEEAAYEFNKVISSIPMIPVQNNTCHAPIFVWGNRFSRSSNTCPQNSFFNRR